MINGIFPVPVYQDGISDEMELLLIQDEITSKCNNLNYAKREGWNKLNHQLSDPTFKSNIIIDNQLEHLEKYIHKSVKNYFKQLNVPEYSYKIVESWMTKQQKGEFAAVHNHPTDIAGTYYYKTNGKDGHLLLLNPNPAYSASRFLLDYRYGIEPSEGSIVLFPGWVNHCVEDNNTDSTRMSLAFNINLTVDSL